MNHKNAMPANGAAPGHRDHSAELAVDVADGPLTGAAIRRTPGNAHPRTTSGAKRDDRRTGRHRVRPSGHSTQRPEPTSGAAPSCALETLARRRLRACPSLDPLGLTALLPVHLRERCRCGPRGHQRLVRSTRPRHLGEAPLELSSARPQLLKFLDRAVESVLQIGGEGRQTDDVVECLGRQMRLVSQPTLGGLVLAANGFGWPLAWPTTARPRCLFTLLSDHGRIVAHFRA
jgi:hypothetical protein